MSLCGRLLLFLYLIVSSSCQLFAQTDAATLDWYEAFFTEDQTPVEGALAQNSARLQEALETHDLRTEASVRKELGLLHLTRTHDFEQAMDFFIRALTIEDSLQLRKEQVITYLAIARVFEEAGNFPKSAEELEAAMEVNRQANDIGMLIYILNKLGRINALSGKTGAAFENYETALKYKDEIDAPHREAEALFNLADLYTQEGKYSQALDHHKQALALWRSMEDRKNEAVCLNRIGELYHRMKNPGKAHANHVVALEIRQSLKDKKGMAESYNNIGALYYQQKNIQRAVDNLQLALEAAREAQAQDQIRKSYEYLSQCYKEAGDYKKALGYRELFVAINDFIQNDKNERQLLETQNRYMLDRKQGQIERLESIRAARDKELATQKQFRNFLIALIGLGFIVAILILYLYIVIKRSNKGLRAANDKVQKQNLQLVDLNATKDKFFSIISHDLKGPLNSLTSFSGLLINHTDSLSKDEIKMLAKDLDKSLKNLFALLENLLEWSRSQTGNIEFKKESFDLPTVLVQNKELLDTQAKNKKITISHALPQNLSIEAHRHSVNTVVRNLISNAIKFTPEGGTITLGLHPTDTAIRVSVADTGVGMSPEIIAKLFRIDTKHTTKGTAEEKGTGLGLILCKEFIEKNGGKIWVESEPGKGSVFYFTLPYQPVTAPIRSAVLQ